MIGNWRRMECSYQSKPRQYGWDWGGGRRYADGFEKHPVHVA